MNEIKKEKNKWFFEKINTMDKSQESLTKKKSEDTKYQYQYLKKSVLIAQILKE